MTAVCPTCLTRLAHDPLQKVRCAYRAELRARVRRLAADAGVSPAAADDLWCHLGSVYEDGTMALDAVVTVLLDLGWRPETRP